MIMDEYIEREAAKKFFNLNFGGVSHAIIAARLIDEIPAADVVPVRHGRWIEPSLLYYGAKQYECSLCYSDTFWKKHSITEKYPHCPNCGCRMDGERKGEANES